MAKILKKNQAELLAKNIFSLQPHIFHSIRKAVHSHSSSIAPTQLKFMRCLHHGDRTINEIADSMGVSPPTASEAISALVKKGYIERKRSPEDRRIVHASLTPKGFKIMNQTYKKMIRELSKNLVSLSTADTKKILQSIDILQKHLSKTSHYDSSQ